MKRLISMWQATCFVYVLLCGGVPYALAESGSLSVLSLNAAGAGTAPPESGAPWDKRAKRIATWAQTNHVVPDIIGLQELWGWLWTPPIRSCGIGFNVGVGDYDQVDRLIYVIATRMAALRGLTDLRCRSAFVSNGSN